MWSVYIQHFALMHDLGPGQTQDPARPAGSGSSFYYINQKTEPAQAWILG
jgi:hypothetical protein